MFIGVRKDDRFDERLQVQLIFNDRNAASSKPIGFFDPEQ